MNAALYTHIPFCKQKCRYCDFYSIVGNESLIEQYVTCLIKEIQFYVNATAIQDFCFDTLYIGGGTPSLLTPKQLDKIINALHRYFHFSEHIEFTLEANPETTDEATLKDFYSCDVNRLSIGVQSFHPKELQLLGRIHTAERGRKSINAAIKAGFQNINIDLIFAIPGQSLPQWEYNLRQAIALSPQHISMYGLTFEPGTSLEQKLKCGEIQKTSDVVEREMYLSGMEILAAHGFNQYEISNFAKSGFASRHNQMYWNGSPYLGLGASAHSFRGRQRQCNVRDVTQYIALINQGLSAVEKCELLTEDQQYIEFIMLSLRTTEGLDVQTFKKRFPYNFQVKFEKALHEISVINHEKIFYEDNGHLKLTAHGFLLYDEICLYFV